MGTDGICVGIIMAMDGLGNQIGFGQTPPKPSRGIDWNSAMIPPAAAAKHSFTQDWLSKAVDLSSRDLATNLLNAGTHSTEIKKPLSNPFASPSSKELFGKAGGTLQNTPLSSSAMERFAKAGANFPITSSSPINGATKAGEPFQKAIRSHATPEFGTSYSQILHLGEKQVSVSDWSWSKHKEAIGKNIKEFREYLKPDQRGRFFEETTGKKYFKETLVKDNFKPIKDLVTNKPGAEVGTGAVRSVGIGVMGLDVFRKTKAAYKAARKKEDGSVKSKLNTFKETATAFGKYAFRDGTTWEAASAGAAIGRAVIPLALGGISIGGVLLGALSAIGVQKLLDKALDTKSASQTAFSGK